MVALHNNQIGAARAYSTQADWTEVLLNNAVDANLTVRLRCQQILIHMVASHREAGAALRHEIVHVQQNCRACTLQDATIPEGHGEHVCPRLARVLCDCPWQTCTTEPRQAMQGAGVTAAPALDDGQSGSRRTDRQVARHAAIQPLLTSVAVRSVATPGPRPPPSPCRRRPISRTFRPKLHCESCRCYNLHKWAGNAMGCGPTESAQHNT